MRAHPTPEVRSGDKDGVNEMRGYVFQLRTRTGSTTGGGTRRVTNIIRTREKVAKLGKTNVRAAVLPKPLA